jgi:regulator of sirC expression with transglutaminase-like and TPR domain
LRHQEEPEEFRLSNYLHEAHPRDILVRMLRNLKALFLEKGRWQDLLAVQQRLMILLPEEILERRDRGLAHAYLNHPQDALDDLRAYLEARPHAPDAEQLRQRIPQLEQDARRSM